MQKKLQKGQERRQEGQNRQAGQAGQGLVEYALVLVLVAVVCIAIIFATGLSVQRVYGLVAGALGTRHNTEDFNGERIVIDQAVCYLVPPGYEGPGTPGMTNVTIHGLTHLPLEHLTLPTDIASVHCLNNLQATSAC